MYIITGSDRKGWTLFSALYPNLTETYEQYNEIIAALDTPVNPYGRYLRTVTLREEGGSHGIATFTR